MKGTDLMKKRPLIAAYYFPNWHTDPRIEALHGKGWTEWEVVKHATPRYPGHLQPKVPLWGYQDESKPEVMAQKIIAAKEHGIDAFIFDWYCFNDGPYRHRCINEGFLNAQNCNDIKFAVMWCNHDPVYAHPGSYWKPAQANWKGDNITPETFRRETDFCIEKYMKRPNYLRVDGGIYYSIWSPETLCKSLGGTEAAAELFREFRDKVQKAGLGELNLNAHYDAWWIKEEPKYVQGEGGDMTRIGIVEGQVDELKKAGFDTISGYCWVGGQEEKSAPFPVWDYNTWMFNSLKHQVNRCKRIDMPCSPVARTGWDSSPRTVQSDMYERVGYPFNTIIHNNTPDQFQYALRQLNKLYQSEDCKSEMIQLACWNEWTEGAYLEPDTHYGYGFLQAVKNVFGDCIEE